MNEFWIYFKLGLTHVLDWNAYDHVLFLIVLVASYTFLEWKRVFLVGHYIYTRSHVGTYIGNL